jgi:HSP20 family molecular chaperone IbpA
MSILLEKTEPFGVSHSSPPCGRAAYVLDRISVVNPEMPIIPIAGHGERREIVPNVGMQEDASAFVFHIPLPGVEPGNIKVTNETNVVSIVAERPEAPHGVSGTCTIAYTARILVPGSGDVKTLKAKYRNGLLELHVNKSAGAGAVIRVE